MEQGLCLPILTPVPNAGVIEELFGCRAGLVAVRNGELGQKRKDETWQECGADLANG